MSNITITDLLRSLQEKPKRPNKSTLPNNKDTWERIGKKDTFSELCLGSSELESFLTEWIKDNPYNF